MQNNGQRPIVVTGTAGFIGYHTARTLLERGNSVVGIDNFSEYYDPTIKHRRTRLLEEYEGYEHHTVSITDYETLQQIIANAEPKVIVHLAAQAGVRYSLTDPWTYEYANNLGTLNIFEIARHNNVRRVVFASSSSVYGSNEKTPFSEDDRTDQPISMYAATKKANEELAHAYHHLYGIETAGIRFFTVYGEYGRPDLALFKFAKLMLRGDPITLYNNGQMQRSFTYADDAVQGVLALVDTPQLDYELYNIGGDTPTELMRIVELLEQELGVAARREYGPLQPGDVPVTHADTNKAQRELGYAPRVPIEEGVAAFCAWFLENREWLMELRDPQQ